MSAPQRHTPGETECAELRADNARLRKAKASKPGQWAYKVVKFQRGGDGKWFAYRAAMTTASEVEAREYAQRFAAEQRGVGGTRINVLTRGGNNVAEYRVQS